MERRFRKAKKHSGQWPHSSQSGGQKEDKRQLALVRLWKGNPCTPLLEMGISVSRKV